MQCHYHVIQQRMPSKPQWNGVFQSEITVDHQCFCALPVIKDVPSALWFGHGVHPSHVNVIKIQQEWAWVSYQFPVDSGNKVGHGVWSYTAHTVPSVTYEKF